ncbi:FAD-dependent oxidoreductase [Flavisolibacter sp. BT320]|nr:FAD-dependent oxidoreductase [Flavisolibacter longurius]
MLVIGGGTGGTAAGIQSARLGAKTIIVESTPWLGGMISAAGVSAVDGNHRLPSGLWAEFRSRLYKRYGGPEALETGWVSNTLFEPRVADSIFKSMAGAEKDLSIYFNHVFTAVTKKDNRLEAVTFTNKANGKTLTIRAKTFIDATELGDVIKAAGIPYDLGMESGEITGEKVGVTETNNIVQDLTYVAVLKDYGKGANKSIPKPANYDPAEFDAACTDYYIDKTKRAPTVDALKMLEYGKLPNNKYMLNWPLSGNDTYLNVVEMTEAEREKELVKAKETTRRFIYFIQQQLGFKHLGLADDEFPTKDRFALIPYHREGRRVKGLVRFTMRHIAEPFAYGDPLYRTGISVGDYPIDHHHKKNLAAPQHLEFYPIPSFNVPLGALIPQNFDNLVVAEKGISVSNVVNGTTRLQPCVLLTGQAAGTLAAISAQQAAALQTVPVRTVQQKLLQTGAYLMPYIDVTPDNPFFEAIQKVGATGILKGAGVPYKWANQTWFYPEQPLSQYDLAEGLRPYYASLENYLDASGEMLTLQSALKLFAAAGVKLQAEKVMADWKQVQKGQALAENTVLNRQAIAWLIDHYLKPFERPVNHKGEVQ